MASTTDKITDTFNAANPNVAKTTATRAAAATTLTCDNLAGWPTASKVHFSTYQVDTSGAYVDGTQIDWSGIVTSSTSIGSLTRVAGVTDNGNAVGDYVEMNPTANWAQDLADALTTEHSRTGVHALTANSTITSSKVITSLNDTNGNELLKVSPTASAVNELTLANAAASGHPSLSATGNDTNININLAPKGTGNITKGGNPVDWWEEIGRTTLSVAGDTLTVSGLPARNFLKVIISVRVTGGNVDTNMTFSGDTGSNYAYRFSANFGAESTATSQTSIPLETSTENVQHFTEMHIENYSAIEKIYRFTNIRGTTAGAANNVQAIELRGKWANTSAQLSSITLTNAGTGDFAIDSTIIVLGHN